MVLPAPRNGREIRCGARHMQGQLVHERYFVIKCHTCSCRKGYGVFHVYDTALGWRQLGEDAARKIVEEGAR